MFSDLIHLDSDWDGTQVSRTLFRTVVQELLNDEPEASLSDVLRHFYSTMGGPDTIKRFLSKYPWARNVYGQEKKRFIEERRPKPICGHVFSL